MFAAVDAFNVTVRDAGTVVFAGGLEPIATTDDPAELAHLRRRGQLG